MYPVFLLPTLFFPLPLLQLLSPLHIPAQSSSDFEIEAVRQMEELQNVMINHKSSNYRSQLKNKLVEGDREWEPGRKKASDPGISPGVKQPL